METTYKIFNNNNFIGFAFIVRYQESVNACISIFDLIQGKIYLQKYDKIEYPIEHNDNSVLNLLYQRANLDVHNIKSEQV